VDSHEGDEYFLIAFNERPQVLLDGTHDGTSVVDRLSIAEPHGATALYDACYLGVEKLTTSSYAKHALLLISDGEDNNSRYMLDQVRKLLRESDVTVYSIGIADLINLTGKAGAPPGGLGRNRRNDWRPSFLSIEWCRNGRDIRANRY